LFFNSPDYLVPQAKSGKEAVYEYEPSGVGSCQSSTGGCVSLISSGTSRREAAFLEATPSGNDVFFLTAAQLLPEDTDTAYDIYDARVCTQVSPCLTPSAPPGPGCSETDACRPAEPGVAGSLTAAGSATTTGQGDAAPQSTGMGATLGNRSTNKPQPKPLTRAEQLARALRACKQIKRKRPRARCEAQARKRWGARSKHKGRPASRTSRPGARMR
jgi:hypothetical protein